ncbi:MAG: VCBS repeat-containing protein, partial [Planctomycetota bacterium]
MRRIPFPFLLSLAAAPLQAQDLGPARLQSAFAPFRAHAVTVDVDLDGDEDLLWCESLGSTVLWMENDGAGRFLGVRWVGAADAPSDGVGTAAVPFDVDADGDLDVVVARFGLFSDDGLGWHENLGAERFAPYATLGYAVPSASVLRVRDVDGDGDDDLLFSIEGSGPAWIEFGGGALGALGALRTVRSWPFALFELEAADLDADGVVDVVWTESFGAGTRWCRGLGGGVFDAPVELSPFGASAAGLRVADADADGDLDVVVATRAPSEVIVVEALGAGTFAAPVVAAASAADFVGLDLVDLDGDGDLDVVTATLDTALAEARENLGALQLGPASPSQLSDVVGPGASVGSADFDGDGLLDPWIAGGTFHWIPGGGSAALGDPFRPGTRVLPDIRAEAGDVDGDGVFELVTADAGSLHVFEGPGDGLAPVQSIPLGFPVTDAPRIVDLDGDGDLDVVVGGGSLAAGAARVVWLENDGLLGPPALVWTGPAAGGATVRTGDADGDGLV